MKHSQSNRREFLSGEAARKAVEQFADGFRHELPKEALPAATVAESSLLMRYTCAAMAVEFQVFISAAAANEYGALAMECLQLLEPLEAQMTIYRPTSEVSCINRDGFSSAIEVEANLFRVFKQAVSISNRTNGAYDMTSGPLSKLWGFYRRQGRMPSDTEIAATLPLIGYEQLLLDEAATTIQFLREGMELNLGGIGKGYALDCLAKYMREEGSQDFLIHGGQSSVLAGGSRGGALQETGWSVGLAHPLRPQNRLAEFLLHDQALGTSGSGTQYFHYQGKRYGHILDPRTGWPASGVLSATVIAPTAAEADALSTAFYVDGVALAEAYCQAHPEISALLVVPSSSPATFDLIPVNLADEQWKRINK
jgi:thiamine biosynthesis lipoprotein